MAFSNSAMRSLLDFTQMAKPRVDKARAAIIEMASVLFIYF
jgi:hypothetical protein